MSMAGEYLPPLVTKLIGDNSDLLAAAAEAEAAMKGFAKTSTRANDETAAGFRRSGREIDDFTELVVRRMRKGEDAVSVLRRELKRANDEVTSIRKQMARDDANQGLYVEFRRAADELERIRGLARKIAPDLLDAGRRGGQSFVGAFIEGIAGLPAAMMPILIGGAVLASPAIAALIASAVTVGLGLGFIGLGGFLANKFIPQVNRSLRTVGSSLEGAMRYAVSGGFKTGLLEALNIFNRYLPIYGRQLRGIFDSLGPVTARLSVMLSAGLESFFGHLAGVIDKISVPGGPLEAFIDTIPMVLDGVATFLEEITENGPELTRFIVDAANALTSFLVQSGRLIGDLTVVYGWAVKLNDAFPFIGWQAQLEAWETTILPGLGDFFVNLWAKIVAGAKAVGGWFANLGSKIWGWLKDAGSAIADWFGRTVAWFKALPGRIVAFLASMPGRVTAVVKRMAHQATYWVGWLVGKWFKMITEVPPKIGGLIAYAWAWVQTKTKEGVDKTISNIKAFVTGIPGFFAQLWTDITGWVSRTWTSVVTWFARTKASAIELVAVTITKIIDWFKTLPDKAAEQGKNFKDRLFTFFKDAKTWLVEAGKDVVRGVVHGIEDMWGWAVGKVKSFGGDLWKGFKEAIGSNSPAKAFFGPGADIPAGVAVGVNRNAWRARDAVTGMLGGATPRFAYAGGGVSPAMASTMTSGPASAAYRGPNMVYTEVSVDGQVLVRAMTPAAQRRKARSGATGLS